MLDDIVHAGVAHLVGREIGWPSGERRDDVGRIEEGFIPHLATEAEVRLRLCAFITALRTLMSSKGSSV
jgi:hypothetical protein